MFRCIKYKTVRRVRAFIRQPASVRPIPPAHIVRPVLSLSRRNNIYRTSVGGHFTSGGVFVISLYAAKRPGVPVTFNAAAVRQTDYDWSTNDRTLSSSRFAVIRNIATSARTCRVRPLSRTDSRASATVPHWTVGGAPKDSILSWWRSLIGDPFVRFPD